MPEQNDGFYLSDRTAGAESVARGSAPDCNPRSPSRKHSPASPSANRELRVGPLALAFVSASTNHGKSHSARATIAIAIEIELEIESER